MTKVVGGQYNEPPSQTDEILKRLCRLAVRCENPDRKKRKIRAP